MKKVKWLFFGLVGTVTDTLVHFYPQDHLTGAPYDLTAKFTIFGEGFDSISVILDGAKINQPNGIKLRDAFSTLNTNNVGGFFGVEVILESTKYNASLENSECVVELLTSGSIIKYRPASTFDDSLESDQEHSSLFFDDRFNSTSLVFVNKSKKKVNFNLASIGNDSKEMSVNLDSNSVREYALERKDFSPGFQQMTSWGELYLSPFCLSEMPEDVTCYNLYRDKASNQPISISSLTT